MKYKVVKTKVRVNKQNITIYTYQVINHDNLEVQSAWNSYIIAKQVARDLNARIK